MNGAQPVDLQVHPQDRPRRLRLQRTQALDFNASYQRETRNGTQPLAFTAGPGIDEIANPIQYTTQDAEVEVEYTKKPLLRERRVHATACSHNDVLYTTVDNPVRLNNTNYFWTGSPVD